jgi:hypothetical protein
MNENINLLNVVIAEINLVAAKLAKGDAPSTVAELLKQAKNDLAEATKKIVGQSVGGGEDN